MLQLASQNFAGRHVLLVEPDADCIDDMIRAIEAAGGRLAGCVSNGLAAVSVVKLWEVDVVVLHTQTLQKEPFPLHEVMNPLGVSVALLTSFDDWFDSDDDADEDDALEVAWAA